MQGFSPCSHPHEHGFQTRAWESALSSQAVFFMPWLLFPVPSCPWPPPKLAWQGLHSYAASHEAGGVHAHPRATLTHPSTAIGHTELQITSVQGGGPALVSEGGSVLPCSDIFMLGAEKGALIRWGSCGGA